MGYFPFFVDISGKRGLIVGGGKIALEKITKILPFGPKLVVVAPEILPEITQMKDIVCEKRIFTEQDIEGAAFVIAATNEEAVNETISRLCQERGILVNVVDDKEKCGFLFPALVKEGSLTIGISTEGASPQVAVSLKKQIASELPDQMDAILDYLSALRPVGKERIADGADRAAFFKEMAVLCMEENRVPDPEETEKWILSYQNRKRYGYPKK